MTSTAPAIGRRVSGLRMTNRGTVLDQSGTVTAHADRGAFVVTFADGETMSYGLNTRGDYWDPQPVEGIRAGRDRYAAAHTDTDPRPSRFADEGRTYAAWGARADAWAEAGR